ncbi:MAG: LytR/AlgR family response regulator transcription factor [Bacteroidia bacterium]
MMNCIIVDDDLLARMLMESLVKQTPSLNLVGVCTSASEALLCLAAQEVDLVFLDIEMPGISGIQMLKYFNRDQIQVIFVSSSEKHAVEAIDLEVTDYLVKPVEEKRFLKAVIRAWKKKNQTGQPNQDLFVKSGSKLLRIGMDQILFMEGLANHISIYTADGKRHIVLSTLKAIESRLPAGRFMRIHNSYIVALDRISVVEENTILIDKKSLPVSRAHKKDLLTRLKTV